MDGQANGLGLVGEGTLDGLLDPPCRIGGKLHPAVRVESLHGLHQADIPLGDQVLDRQAVVRIIMGDLHDEAQVGLNHVRPRRGVALADAFRKGNLFLPCEQGGLDDLPQVDLQAPLFGVSVRGGWGRF